MSHLRLERAREREAERRKSETQEKREQRLRYSRQQAALRRDLETPEQRERRLEVSRMRVAQRRYVQVDTFGTHPIYPYWEVVLFER